MDTPFTLTSESIYMLVSLVVIAVGAFLAFLALAAGSRAKAAAADARRAAESANPTGDFARLVGDLQRQVSDLQKQVSTLHDEIGSLSQIRAAYAQGARNDAPRGDTNTVRLASTPRATTAPASAAPAASAPAQRGTQATAATDQTMTLGEFTQTGEATSALDSDEDTEGTIVAGKIDMVQLDRDAFHGHAMLRVLSGANEGEVFNLPYDKCTMGRSPTNRIVLNEEKASRVHAELRFENNRFKLKDNGSTNGTLRNGAPITEVALEFGDKITIGRTQLIFTSEGFELQASNARGAAIAYEKVLELQPKFIPALQNLAFLLERDVARRHEAEGIWKRLREAEA